MYTSWRFEFMHPRLLGALQSPQIQRMSSADWELRKSLIGERNTIIGQLNTDEELLQILAPLRSYDERSEAYCGYEMDH
jgi:hypothetical protein